MNRRGVNAGARAPSRDCTHCAPTQGRVGVPPSNRPAADGRRRRADGQTSRRPARVQAPTRPAARAREGRGRDHAAARLGREPLRPDEPTRRSERRRASERARGRARAQSAAVSRPAARAPQRPTRVVRSGLAPERQRRACEAARTARRARRPSRLAARVAADAGAAVGPARSAGHQALPEPAPRRGRVHRPRRRLQALQLLRPVPASQDESHGVYVPNQLYNFVRTSEGEMLLHNRYRHPSIAEGRQVLYAGEVRFNNGKLEWVVERLGPLPARLGRRAAGRAPHGQLLLVPADHQGRAQAEEGLDGQEPHPT